MEPLPIPVQRSTETREPPPASGDEAKRPTPLKGAGATFSAVRLASVCEALERAGREGDVEEARSLTAELEDAWAATQAGLQTGLQPSRR